MRYDCNDNDIYSGSYFHEVAWRNPDKNPLDDAILTDDAAFSLEVAKHRKWCFGTSEKNDEYLFIKKAYSKMVNLYQNGSLVDCYQTDLDDYLDSSNPIFIERFQAFIDSCFE